MINDIHFPDSVTGTLLDEYLARGWYRMGQVMFTTDKVIYTDKFLRVHWIRYNIGAINFSKSHRRIITANSNFTTEFKPLELSQELEDLYELYRHSRPFDPSDSVEDYLYGGSAKDIFSTKVIELREKGKLIAAGIFDLGQRSVAGIMNFYDPAYKRYSPGKYMMLLKVQFARENDIEWYYPGYLMEDNPRFDYKLFLGRELAEVFLANEERWVLYSTSSTVPGFTED